MPEYWFSLTLIFSYKDRIVYSNLMREDTGQGKPVIWYFYTVAVVLGDIFHKNLKPLHPQPDYKRTFCFKTFYIFMSGVLKYFKVALKTFESTLCSCKIFYWKTKHGNTEGCS